MKEMLAEQGLDVSQETIRRWFVKFGPVIGANLRLERPTPSSYWHLIEMVVLIRGRRYWLWRAVDADGKALELLVQPKRDTKAAIRLMKKLLDQQGSTPIRIVNDELRSYRTAFQCLGLKAEHDRDKGLTIGQKIRTNRLEDGRARYSGSYHPVQLSASCAYTPRTITLSINRDISRTGESSINFEQKLSYCGQPRRRPSEKSTYRSLDMPGTSERD